MKQSEGPIHLTGQSTLATPTDEPSDTDNNSTDNLPSNSDWQMVDDNVELLQHPSEPEDEPPLTVRTTNWRSSIQDFIGSVRAAITPYATGERSVRDLLYRYRYVVAFLVFSWIMGALFWAFKREIFEGLETLSHVVEGMGAGGYALIGSLIFLSAFPPMIGYGTYQTLSGFTFGFLRGFPLSYFGALAGSVTCFYLSRRFLKKRVLRLVAKYPKLEAVVHAVEKKGFKLFVLIRLAPYPFNIMNVMFAATDISLATYTLGTAISLIKIGIHVYIGATLPSFAKHILGEDDDDPVDSGAQIFRYTAMILGTILSMGVMVYIYFIAKKAVEDVIRENNAESRGFLSTEANPRASSDEWMEWVDSDDEEAAISMANHDNIILTASHS
ncbi:hypothetical protein INT43_003003 [Umbelopsis isabellina]|uniref:Golgi apparatus membrane protein TVP38 n=1 Tax=Mortierella isabellina TaxID=91625 RepID=A0A8H7U9X3_MORIS|nr:hypothetical protein INT43_003003 [Umbelopsis isabellina]